MNKKIFAGTVLLLLAMARLLAAEESGATHELKSPDWFKSARIYQVYLRDYSQEGKLSSLENDLFKLKNLGVNCIDLLPIQPSGLVPGSSLGNPMMIKDFNGVGLEYGTKDGLKSFVEQVHFNEMRLILDWVLDKASADNPLVKEHPEWFLKGEAGDERDAVQFDFKSEEMRDHVKGLLSAWLKDCGFDGYRFIGTERAPADFINEIKAEILQASPGAVIFVDGPLPPGASVHAVGDQDFYGLISSLAQGGADASSLQKIFDQDAGRVDLWPVPVRYLESFDHPRSARLFGRAAEPAAVLLFSLDGTPLILSGQEIAELRQPSPISKTPIDWPSGLKKNFKVRRFYKQLMGLRAKHPALSRGQKFPMRISDSRSVIVFAASFRDDAVLTAVNFSSEPYQGVLDLPEIFVNSGGKINLRPSFTGGELSQISGSRAGIKLSPWGYQIWEMK